MSGVNGILGSIFGSPQLGRTSAPAAGGASAAVDPFANPASDSVSFSAASQVGLQAGNKSIFDQLVDGDVNPAAELHPDVLSRLADGSFMNDVVA